MGPSSSRQSSPETIAALWNALLPGKGQFASWRNRPECGVCEDISPDGKTLLLNRGPLDTTVFSLSLDGVQKEPKSLLQTGETISHARFSPDGRWIVYTASAAGSERGGIYTGGGTYVQPYPGPGLRKQVTSRGNYPVWRKDGKEIVYLDEYQGRNYIWSVPLAARGNEFQAGTPSPLFPARLPATTFGDLNFLAVSRDGSRFYIPQARGTAGLRRYPRPHGMGEMIVRTIPDGHSPGCA